MFSLKNSIFIQICKLNSITHTNNDLFPSLMKSTMILSLQLVMLVYISLNVILKTLFPFPFINQFQY